MISLRTLLMLSFYLVVALLLVLALLQNNVIPGEQYQGALSLWSTWLPKHALLENIDFTFNMSHPEFFQAKEKEGG